MRDPINLGYHYCKSTERNVSLEQSEEQCRERHNCADGPCPLESEFNEGRFSRAITLLLSGLNRDPDS
ncbi:MAG TPA: hypothetical protein PLK44_13380 [Aestuariivirga sp.]|jgi:hypothetical protein|nr:hypothetical protein [Aestuariivirga sp.]HQY74699.1 hypothetical protein [Aestuariivirga sp.]HRA94634.1 hypothetical protein [Aestuariivirga sp.]